MITVGPGVVVGSRVTVAGTVQIGDRTSAGPGVVVTPGQPTDLNSLFDVDTAGSPAGVPLVWRRGVDAIYRLEAAPTTAAPRWGDEIAFDDQAPDLTTTPPNAVWVDITDGTIYRAEET